MKILLILLSAFFASGSAIAQEQQSKAYMEVGGIYARYQEPSAWFTSAVGNVKLGMNINDNISIEGVLATSLSDTNFYVGSTYVSARIDHIYAGYLKAKAPFSPDVDYYVRFGMARGQVSASTTYGSSWASDSGVSYGGGLQFKTSNTSYIAFDYMSFYNKSGVSVTGFGLNFGHHF